MINYDPGRRQFLQATSGAIALGVIAGCLGDDGNGTSNGGNGNGSTEEYDFGDWFNDVDNYDGVVDHTGENEVTVRVGAGQEGYQFDPAAIAVDTGTTVVWEWTGDGGGHNVVADDSFESEIQTDEGATFDQTFEEAATYEYYCSPHVNQGMKGAIVVE
ncbi:halocyanin domain-containing protein [Saliphagus infecundisoli]|uniref:Halocyanin domain-containing protein n=1 Tax=Saliphagus infecundisoli TaxID=1849069 RepID=A0ABD5QN20_9EURY|nr:halocyanin domain-containing protein [Saliphagus infecundisoli]